MCKQARPCAHDVGMGRQ